MAVVRVIAVEESRCGGHLNLCALGRDPRGSLSEQRRRNRRRDGYVAVMRCAAL